MSEKAKHDGSYSMAQNNCSEQKGGPRRLILLLFEPSEQGGF